ncbi:MAG TPA: hypothetical protein PK913_15880, partial [Phenylobacterium sp.]|nr:hypothetical protein [Phenylobacterium sp.]
QDLRARQRRRRRALLLLISARGVNHGPGLPFCAPVVNAVPVQVGDMSRPQPGATFATRARNTLATRSAER